MNDLISREQALNAVEWDTEAYTAINMLPSIDAVQVVRCRDCKHYAGEGKRCDWDICVQVDRFYCYYGERKES